MALQPFDYQDFSGGLNKGAAPSNLKPNELAELENWYPYAGRLRRRGGVMRLTSKPWSAGGQLSGMFPLRKADGTWVMIVASGIMFGKLDGTEIVQIPFRSGASFTPPQSGPLLRPWSMFAYKGYVYALNSGTSRIFRMDSEYVGQAGITPPLPPTISQGVVGTLTAGDYVAVMTAGNQATGYESNPSAVSNTLTLAASKTIDYATPVHSDPFVNMRKLYRCLVNQGSTLTYFLVKTILNNTDATFAAENVAIAAMGAPASFKNGVPPSTLKRGCIWPGVERLFAIDDRDLYYSEQLNPEAFGASSVISIFPDGGFKMMGVQAMGERLVWLKEDMVGYLTGQTPSSFAIDPKVITNTHGCRSGASVAAIEGRRMFWFGTGKAVYSSDGATARDISTPKIKPYLDAIPDAYEEYVVGQVYAKHNWYILSIPQPAGTKPYVYNSVVLVYNYREDNWTVFTHPKYAPAVLGRFFTTDGSEMMYSASYDYHLYEYAREGYGKDDALVPVGFGGGAQMPPAPEDAPVSDTIEALFTTPASDFSAPGYRKAITEVWMIAPQVAGDDLPTPGDTLTFEILRDSLSSIAASRNASLDIANTGYKAYRLPAKYGSTLQLRVRYKNEAAIDIDALHLQVDVTKRTGNSPR